jgi:hypothetical protein
MNWEAIGALGEALSAVGLFFVLIQVRHARADMRRTVLDSFTNSLMSTVAISTEARVLSAIMKAHAGLGGQRPAFVAALMDQAGLTEDEARLVSLQQGAQWQAFAQAARNSDTLRPADRVAIETNMRQQYANSPVGSLWFQSAKATMNPEILRYMDRVLAEPG